MSGRSPSGRACAPSGLSQSSLSQPKAPVPNAKRWTRSQHDALGSDKGFLPAAYWPMPLVIIESPYAGDIGANVAYARAAMRDSLNRGEAPIASHLLYTQPGILRDEIPDERQWGIDAGLAWRDVADLAAFYIDRGWSSGMVAARETYDREGKAYELRSLASGMEARRVETEGFDAKHDSPTPKGDAQ